MNTIQFSHNWNHKLNNQIFTTIRGIGKREDKVRCYEMKEGEIFLVLLKNKPMGRARLISVSVHQYSELPKSLLMVDTGITKIDTINSVFEKFGVTENSSVIILTFKKEDDDV